MHHDACPPIKKRKKATVSVLSDKQPQLLDLHWPLSDLSHLQSQKSQVDALLKLLRKKKKIVVVAGAGISVGAGSRFLIAYECRN